MNDIDIKELGKEDIGRHSPCLSEIGGTKKERRRRISVFTGWKDCSC